MAKTLFIDGDWIVYAAGFAGEKTEYMVAGGGAVFTSMQELKDAYGDDTPASSEIFRRTVLDPLDHVLHSAKSMVVNVHDSVCDLTKFAGWSLRIIVSPTVGVPNARHDIATIRPYKGNRTDARKPTYHAEIVDYLTRNFPCLGITHDESDDCLSVLAHGNLAIGKKNDYVIAGIDKDLMQIPGWHYLPKSNTMHLVRPNAGRCFVYRQAVTGDPTDNIAGAYKVGPKTVEGLITPEMTEKEMQRVLIETYDRTIEDNPERVLYAGLTGEEAARENLRLVRLSYTAGDLAGFTGTGPIWPGAKY